MKRLIILLAGILVLAAYSFAIVDKRVGPLISVDDRTTTITGTTFTLGQANKETSRGIGRLVAVRNGADADETMDCVIEHSPKGTTFSTLITFAQVTVSNSTQDVHIAPAVSGIYKYVRGKCTLGGTTPDYDIDIDLYHD